MRIGKFRASNRGGADTRRFEAGPEMDRVIDLLLDGKKVTAIKAYRELTGAGLREAKEAIDVMESRL